LSSARARVAELADALASGAKPSILASCLPSTHSLKNQRFRLDALWRKFEQISLELVTGIGAEFRFTPRQSLEAKARKVIIAPVSRAVLQGRRNRGPAMGRAV